MPLLSAGADHRRVRVRACWRCRRAAASATSRPPSSCLVGVIVVGFAFQMLHADPVAVRHRHGLLVPGFAGTESVLLAAGILGATVMPHVIYLHSALTQRRVVGENDARAAADLPVRARRRDHRDDDRRAGQHGDADHRRRRLPRQRPDRGRHASTRPTPRSAASSASTPSTMFGDRAARLRAVLVVGRHARRPGRDAGVHPPPDPALRAPRRDDGAGDARARDRRRPVQGAGAEPGRALVRHPVRADPARASSAATAA